MAASSGYWADRNARARAAGYRNYYDYRVHDYGRRPPSAPAPRGAELRRLRGHAGPSDLERLAGSGRAVMAIVAPTAKDDDGRVTEVRITVTDDEGKDRDFWLRGKDLEPGGRADRIAEQLGAAGATVLDAYNLLGEEKGPSPEDEEPELGWAAEDVEAALEAESDEFGELFG